MAAVTSAGRASGLEPLELGADSVAAAALFERHSTHVFRYCNSRLGRREDAEDAVQTTFLYAVRSLRRGVKPLVESAWLLGIARNVCLSRWEASGRRNRLEAVCDPHVLGRTAAAPQGRREELIGLEDALARLPERQRRAVLLRDWRGLSYDEVAEQLGVSRAAVETLIFRGRERLAELLREEPSTIRRRLTSLGNLGALVNGVKTAFTGGATAIKVATAVTAVAASGAAVVASPLIGGGRIDPVRPSVPQPALVPTPVVAATVPATVPATAHTERAYAAPERSLTQPAGHVGLAPAARGDGVPAVAGHEAPAAHGPGPAPTADPRATPPAAAAPDPPTKREPTPPAVRVVDTTAAPTLLAPVTTTVDEVVTTLVPSLPVAPVAELPVAELPVVGPVAETIVKTAEDTVAALPVPPLEVQLPVPGLPPADVPPLPLP